MNNDNKQIRYGCGDIGFTGIITIIFIVLKLLNVVEWSWWLVFSPIWISFGIYIVISLILMIVAMIFAVVTKTIKENISEITKEKKENK